MFARFSTEFISVIRHENLSYGSTQFGISSERSSQRVYVYGLKVSALPLLPLRTLFTRRALFA
ncbi:MAG: hypothetical protein AAFS10_18495, partial [Myxococcota bacterium]